MSTTEATTGSRVGRGRLTPGQLWQVPAFVIGLASFLAVAVSAPIRHPVEWWQFDAAVAELRQGLQIPDPDAEQTSHLVSLAETVLLQLSRFGDRAAEVQFLAGSAYYRQALTSPPEFARELWQRAVEHLEEAQEIQTPADRDLAPLEYRLGRSLFALNRDVPRALELMGRSVDKGADQPLAGYRMLIDAYLKLPQPDLDAALIASRRAIELTDEHDPDQTAQARLAHVDLLLRKDLRAEAIRELDRIGSKVSPPLRVRARLTQARLCEEEGMWSKAAATWQLLLADASSAPGADIPDLPGLARIQYAIGWCSAQTVPPDLDRTARAWQAALKLGGPEGQAAGLRLGGLRLFGPAPDLAQGVHDWQQALTPVKTPADFQNPCIELADVRALFEQAMTLCLDQDNYPQMRTIAEIYRKVAAPGQTDERIGQAIEAMALKQSEAAPPEKVRNLYRQAADAFDQAAAQRAGKDRFNLAWHGVQCALAAHESERTERALWQLDQLDREDARLAEGWYLLADAYRTAGQRDRAVKTYLKAMEYAATPFAARARYELALDAAGRKQWKEAEEILAPNVKSQPIDREAHEKSLYQMAWIEIQKQDFGLASLYLKQATGIYPNNSAALVVRGQLAECYRRLADDAFHQEERAQQAFRSELSVEKKEELDELLHQLQGSRKKYLQESLTTFQALADDLRERERHRPLEKLESVLSQRALLGVAECLHDLGELLDALHLYQELLRRNRRKIEGLIACERLVKLMDLAPRTDLLTPEGKNEARVAGRLAATIACDDLKQMDPGAPDFQGTGVWSRQKWQEWAADLQRRFEREDAATQLKRPSTK